MSHSRRVSIDDKPLTVAAYNAAKNYILKQLKNLVDDHFDQPAIEVGGEYFCGALGIDSDGGESLYALEETNPPETLAILHQKLKDAVRDMAEYQGEHERIVDNLQYETFIRTHAPAISTGAYQAARAVMETSRNR